MQRLVAKRRKTPNGHGSSGQEGIQPRQGGNEEGRMPRGGYLTLKSVHGSREHPLESSTNPLVIWPNHLHVVVGDRRMSIRIGELPVGGGEPNGLETRAVDPRSESHQTSPKRANNDIVQKSTTLSINWESALQVPASGGRERAQSFATARGKA